jgi:succinate dehydrogenase / fumarate reductase, cytochrome b subunit
MGDWADPRPMSPHAFAWRWHVTMAVSILHRVTGVMLYAGAIGLAVWLVALAAGPGAYHTLLGLAPAWLIWAKIYALVAVLAFHFANGVRHLFWDAGVGFKPATANLTAWLVIVFTFAAPAALYLFVQR